MTALLLTERGLRKIHKASSIMYAVNEALQRCHHQHMMICTAQGHRAKAWQGGKNDIVAMHK